MVPGRRLLALLAVCAVIVSGCGLLSDDGSERAAEAFVTAWSAGDDAGAAARTDDPEAAGELLAASRSELGARGLVAELEQVRSVEGSATASVTVRWDLGSGRTWSYLGELELLPTGPDGGWQVRWAPTVVHPQLGAGQRLALRTEAPEPAPVLDRSGAPLLEATPVVTVLLDRTAAGDLPAVTGELADALSPIDPAITSESITDGAAGVPDGQAYPVAVLREVDYQGVQDAIYDLPGVRFTTSERLLAPDAGFARQVLPAVRTEAGGRLLGTPGWSVLVVGQAGGSAGALTEVAPQPGSPVTLRMDRALQTAAEDAVEPVDQQAMLVAVQPSTGDLLAVAQNGPADEDGPLALTGRYPPGSTFKVVTAAAAIAEQGLSAGSPVECPAETVIDGRTIPNAEGFGLGTAPLIEAFARSCNTTFAQLAADLDPAALPTTANTFGLGADYAVPGLVTITGSVPTTGDVLARAVNGIGQGEVLASPLGMAIVAATAANGAPVVPRLWAERPTEVLAPAASPDAAAVAELRPMMRAVVTSGTAEQLSGRGQLSGKTGTAEFTGDGRAHGWFIGHRGDAAAGTDVAFAVLVVDGESSAPALTVADRFLESIS